MSLLKRFTALLLSVFFILTMTACDGTSKAYIYFTLAEQPQTLDPQTASSDTELMLVRNIFEGLLRKDQDGNIVPAVAERYEKKGLTYTFYLREDAVWSNEETITAHDFVFAFKRAVNPETKCPFAQRLSSIKNAPSIIKGKKSVSDLGVKALDNSTLQIQLATEDENFEETLTTSIAMPCNESFFKESAGKYGLEKETTLSNGSYRLAKWGKEIFGIRLYRNKFYTGKFVSKNAAVFLSIDKERTPLQVLLDQECDIGFINSSELDTATEAGLKTAKYNNICWFLTISDGFSKGIRTSLINLASPQIFSKDLGAGYNVAEGIFPDALTETDTSSGMPVYDLQAAKKLFATEVAKLSDKKFPTNVVLYYYDDGHSKSIVTDIVGHWQNQLGAFVNIESVSGSSVLLPQLKNQTYALSIFPVSADSTHIEEYLEKFGIDYNGEDLEKIQSNLLKSKNIVPLMTQNTIVAYSEDLENLNFSHGNGSIDFAYIVKKN